MSAEVVANIEGFTLPETAPFASSAWPATPEAREVANREIERRINARLAANPVTLRAVVKLADEEVLRWLEEKN